MKENQIMSDAVKQRTALRGWVTRTSRKLDSVCMGKQVDKFVLTDLIEEFDKHMDKLDNVQSQIEIEMDIDQLDQEIDSAGNFRDKVRIPRIEAGKLLGKCWTIKLTLQVTIPQDIRMEWAREGEGHESDLSWLLEFLKKEIQRRERSQTFRETPPASEKTQPSVPEERRRVASVATLSSFSDSRCGICHKPHQTERCWDLTNYPISVRRDKILKAGLCFRCLGQGHIARGCEQKCFYCKRGHHALLCSPSTSVKTSTSEPHSQNVPVSHSVTTRVSSVNTNDVKTRILLQSASVEVRGQRSKGCYSFFLTQVQIVLTFQVISYRK